MTATPLNDFMPGFRLPDGSQLNQLVETINAILAGTQQLDTLDVAGAAEINGLLTLVGLIVLSNGDLAAAGSNQGTAAAITKTLSNVTGANGTLAVRLPTPVPGQPFFVYNSVATNGLPIFPPSGAAINGGTGDAAVTIEGKTLAVFIATSATNYAAIFTANT